MLNYDGFINEKFLLI